MKRVLSVLMTVIMLASVLVVSVSAATSFPSPTGNYTVTGKVKDDVGGTVNVDPATVPQGETSTITAKPADGYDFVGWTIEGDFEWVSGDEHSLVIVIRPKSDIVCIAEFKGKGGKTDDNPVSPGTGYNTGAAIAVMAVVMTIGTAAVVVSGRKYYNAK